MQRLLRLRMIGQHPPANQPAIGHQLVALWMKSRLDDHRSRLVFVELERSQEIHLFNGFDVPSGMHTQRRFRECLDAHDARQHRSAIDLVVVEERLHLGIERGFHRQAAVNAHAGDGCRPSALGPAAPCDLSKAAVSNPPVGVPLIRAERPDAVPTTISPRVPPVVSSRRIRGMPASGGSMSIPASSIILGIEPRVAMPIPPQAVQSMTMPRVCGRVVRKLEVYLAQQIVGGAVVGLAAVAEASGDRTECHRRAQRHVADRMQQVEPAVGLHVEDQIEFALVFVRQEVAALHACGVQQHVDAAAVLLALGRWPSRRLRVREVDAEVVSRSACRSHRIDCAQGRVRTLQRRQLFFHQRRSGSLAARLNAGKQIALEAVFVIDEACESGLFGSGSGTRSSR